MIHVFVSLLAFHHFLEQVSRICLSFSLPSLSLHVPHICLSFSLPSLSLHVPHICLSFSLPSLFLACSAYLSLFQPSITFSSKFHVFVSLLAFHHFLYMIHVFVSLLAFHHFLEQVSRICLSFSLPSLSRASFTYLSLFQPSITFSTCSAYLSLFQPSITFSSMFNVFVSLLAFHHFLQHVQRIRLSFSLPSLSLACSTYLSLFQPSITFSSMFNVIVSLLSFHHFLQHVQRICLSFTLPSLSLHDPRICLSFSLPSLSRASFTYLSLFQPSITFST